MPIGLDNPVFAGRVRNHNRRSYTERRTVVSSSRSNFNDFQVRTRPHSVAKQTVYSKPMNTLQGTIVQKGAIGKVRSAPKAPPVLLRTARSKVLKRQIVPKPMIQRKKVNKLSLKGKGLMTLAVILFIFAIGIGFSSLRTNRRVEAQVKQIGANSAKASNNDDNAVPDETPPTSAGFSSYKSAVDLPRYITIDKIGVRARVYALGVKSGGALKAPSNIYNAGWYDASSKPGQAGAELIDGHVHGPTQAGVFFNLKKLVAGDIIKVQRGDGQIFSYKVVTTKYYDADKVDMASALVPITPGKPGLNLITCTGSVKGTEYEQRLMVFAAQI